MQKKKLLSSGILTVIVVSLLAVAMLYAAPAEQGTPSQATLIPLAGTIEVLPAGGAAWVQVAGTHTVGIGDRIRTGVDGMAAIVWFDDETRMEIYANSEVYIADFTVNVDGSFRVETTVFNGIVVNRVQRDLDVNSRYLTNTPTIQVSANRGVVGLGVQNTLETHLAVIDGAILATHQQSAEEMVIRAGNGLIMPLRSLNITPPVPLGEVDAMLLAKAQGTPDLVPMATAEADDGSSVGPSGTEEVLDAPSGTEEPDDDDDSGRGRGRGRGGDDDTDDDADDDIDDDDDDD